MFWHLVCLWLLYLNYVLYFDMELMIGELFGVELEMVYWCVTGIDIMQSTPSLVLA